jgi:16S rRNA processing protein RimM
LPVPEADEFYHADLIGLTVALGDGSDYGTVKALYDFGAGEVIEILPRAGGQPVILPFTHEAVPVIDVAAGRLVVVPPDGLLDTPRDEGDGA